jgi:hypothetical protein
MITAAFSETPVEPRVEPPDRYAQQGEGGDAGNRDQQEDHRVLGEGLAAFLSKGQSRSP